MNILFLNPPFKQGRFSRASRSPAVTKGGTLYYPLWLAYGAGAAEQAGHKVKLIDCPAEGLGLGAVFDRLKDFKLDIAILETSTPSIHSDVHMAETLKKKFPETFVVLVGTHPSALPRETLKLSRSVDAVAMGEYDVTMVTLADTLAARQPLNTVDGLAFRDGANLILNKPRTKIENLDSLPFVSAVYKKHLNYRNYFFAAANYPLVMIITGRGCPNRCFFCVYPQVFHGRRFRMRSVENVVAEFEYIVQNFPKVKEVGIEDDCFTADKKRVRDICEMLIAKKIKIRWYCNVRGNLDYEQLLLMKRAGCRLVTVGFESASQEVLNNINKGETVARYKRFMADAHKAGVLVHGCMMAGNPGDTSETLQKSYEFAKKLNCDSMQFYPLFVYPGTEAYAWAKEKKYLTTENYKHWLTQEGLHNCVIDTPALSGRELTRLCDNYLRRYHLRPRYLLQKILQVICHPSEGYRTFKSGLTFVGKLLAEKKGKKGPS
jgi:anaerobic magnesium-protoporphyrin IX monomethyl ester cyclase